MSQKSVYPAGFASGLVVRGVPWVNTYDGDVFWVDSGSPYASNAASHGTEARPYASIDYAVGRATANNGDIIFVKAGHTETVSSATACVFDKAGITVVFLGNGTEKATFNLTATGAYVNVTAANVTLIGPRFLTGVDAVTKGLQVAAADFKMFGARYYDAAAKASTIQVLTTSAADRMIIDDYIFVPSTTGTQKTDGIKTVGGDRIVLRNIDIAGDFSTGNIDLSTAATNITLEDLNLNNINAGPVAAMVLHANCTGFAKNVKCRVASGTTYISSVAKLQWASDCEGFSTDGYAGEPLGTALGTGLEGKVDTIITDLAVPTADVVTNTLERDVVGNKTDAAVNTVGTTKTIMAYAKGIVNEITVPTADVADNGFTNDVVGNKADAAVVAVGTTKSLQAYAKGILTHSIQRKKVISVNLAAAALTGTTTQFTVSGGPIRVLNLGLLITTVLPAGANTLKFSFTPTSGGATDLSAATDTASAAESQLFILDGVKATALVKTTDVGILAGGQALHLAQDGIILSTGVIQTIFSAGPPATGAATLFLEYEPLTAAATVA